MTHFYAWVRVGDGDPEPAAVEGKNGERKATTIGCPDPFLIDEKDCPCSLVYINARGPVEIDTLDPPDTPIGEATAKKLAREYNRYIKTHEHSYAGFGRRCPGETR